MIIKPLSSKDFDTTTINLLCNKGHKFTPVPKRNLTELKSDVKTFCRKLRLLEFFADKPMSYDTSLVKPKSNFMLKRNRDIYLTHTLIFR